MSRASKMVILGIAILALVIPSIGCLSDDITATSLVPRITAVEASATAAKVAADAAKAEVATVKADVATRATAQSVTDVNNRINNLSGTNSYQKTETYTKGEIDAAIAKAITDYKATLGTSGTNSTNTNNTVAGTISYSILNPSAYYQFAGGGNNTIGIKIINNKADARYVRLQLSLTTLSGGNAGAATFKATVVSNSLGQGAVFSNSDATSLVIPSAVTTVLYIATTGGSNGNGEYLLSSGTAMDLYITVTQTNGNSVLWNVAASGSDRSIQ